MSSEIREGFLCPICLQDLGEIGQLQAHVAEAHKTEQDQPMVMQIKGLLGKAKQRILHVENNALQRLESVTFTSGESKEQICVFEEQEPGSVRSHTKDFRKIRDSRIDQMAVETNKLIIRLDKLISQAPTEPAKRKGKLTNPAFAAECGPSDTVRAASNPKSQSGSPVRRAEKLLTATISTVLKRDGSELSLGSFLNQAGEEHLRICVDCKDLLERRDTQMEQRASPPVLVQMYERLKTLMDELVNLYPSYARMAHSLNAGESMYTLDAAKELKLKVLKLQEQIDSISKKIQQLGQSGPEDPSPRQVLLQRNIRILAANFLQETVIHIPNLPTPEEYIKLQISCKQKLAQNIEQERLAAAQKSVQRTTSTPSNWPDESNGLIGRQNSKRQEGWSADTSSVRPIFHYNPFIEDEQPIDPLQQQILIIKGYLKQAAESGRLEEVQMLEQNLRELEVELKQQNLATPRL